MRYLGEPVVAVVADTRERARDAAELVVVEYEPLDAGRRRARRAGGRRPVLHEECGGNLSYSGVWEWGDVEAAFAEADHVVRIGELHFDRFNSTPLECDGALVEYNRGTGQWTMHTNNQFPGFAVIMMGPAMRVGLDKLRIVTQDIGGGFGNKITSHPQLVVCCLLARKLNRAIQWTEWRTDFHQSMSHGNERWFEDTEVAVKADGTLLGFRTKAIDDAGAYLRYEPLGGVIWSQVAAGMYKWRNIRLEFTQAMTNKAPVSPNRGYSRMQHLWFTERIIDIVAPRARLRSGRDPQEELRPARGHAVRDAERLRLRLRRLSARARHGARARRRRPDRGAAGGGRLAREAPRARDRLDARLGDEQLRPVAADQPRPPVLREQRGRDRQARHLRRGRRHARHDAAGAGPRDDGGAGRRRHPQLRRRRGARARRARQLLELACRASPARMRASSPSPGSAPSRAPRSCSPGDMVKLASMVFQCPEEAIELADGFARIKDNPEAALPFMALGAIPNANNAGFPEDPPTMNRRFVYRPPFQVPDKERKFGNLTLTYATQIHACVVEIDPETGVTEVVDYAAVDDCGVRINPQIVEGQVMGATAHAIGAALWESFAYDEDGNLLTPNFYDYHVPHALDMPPLKTGSFESPSPFTPLGTKGMGEGGGGGIHCICAGDPGRAARRRRRDRDGQPQSLPPGLGAALAPGALERNGGGDVQVIVSGTKELDAPREIVWDVINDPEQMAGLMPGVEEFEIQDDRHWQAKVKVPLGLGGLKMTIDFEKLEERPLEFASLNAKGKGVGALMNMTTSFTLSGDGEQDLDGLVGGREDRRARSARWASACCSRS